MISKLRTLLISTLIIVACAAKVDPIPEAERSKWDHLTCEQVTELYGEMGILYVVSSNRLKKVKGDFSRKLWMELKLLSLYNHDSLLLARAHKCRQA
jgi:hypothetical protein